MAADRDREPPVAGSADPGTPGEAWLSERPPEVLRGREIVLRRWSDGDAGELVDAVNDTLDELRPWMPWAQQPATPEGIAAVIREGHEAWESRREFSYTVREAGAWGTLIGCCGLHDRVGTGALEIGYWVRTGHGGRGVATEAAGLLTRSALGLGGVGRVEIHCDPANARSASIPPKLGFVLDRVEHRPPETAEQSDRQMVWVKHGSG